MNENPWLGRRILNYAHQGGAHEGPSSTLFAIDRALGAGAGAIELDVHATKDRHLVVCHDETVDRTTNGRGEICDLTLSELQELDNAYWFIEGSDVAPGQPAEDYVYRGKAPENRSFGIVTLEEVVRTFPGVPINLDIKRSTPEVEAYEALLAEELFRLKRDEDTIVASFNDLALRSFRTHSPQTPTSAATMEVASWYQALRSGTELPALGVVAFQVPEEFAGITLVDQEFVETAHAKEIAVHVWTVNQVAAMERLVDLGVDGIITDRPSELAQVLGDRAWRIDGKAERA